MQANARDLYNVINFDTVPDNRTKISSYGIGYENTPKYRSLMKFFIQGKDETFQQLIKYLKGSSQFFYSEQDVGSGIWKTNGSSCST